MSGKHRKPTSEEHEAQAAFLDRLARDLGLSWRNRAARLGNLCGVSASRVRNVYSGRVYVTPATLDAWKARATARREGG